MFTAVCAGIYWLVAVAVGKSYMEAICILIALPSTMLIYAIIDHVKEKRDH